jgi:urease accessory protein
MLSLTRKLAGPVPFSAVTDAVALPWDTRCRTRLRVTLESGREAGIVLPRSERLRHGDQLRGEEGGQISVVTVLAAEERLLEVRATELLALTRAAYHLGNRHVPVQVVDILTLRLPVDRVLADLLEGLGLEVREVLAPFEPEGGAYDGGHGGLAADLHATDHTHMLDRSAPVRIRRSGPGGAVPAAEAVPAGLVDPGHGEHRSPRRIHEFSGNEACAGVAP